MYYTIQQQIILSRQLDTLMFKNKFKNKFKHNCIILNITCF